MKTFLIMLLFFLYSGPMNQQPSFEPPLQNEEPIVSRFGPRTHPIVGKERLHEGVDFNIPEGTSVIASANGVITFAGKRGSYGNLIIIDHQNGYETYYAHLSGRGQHASKGEHVQAGDVIGRSGVTGLVVAPVLHFEIRKNGKPLNPERYLDYGK